LPITTSYTADTASKFQTADIERGLYNRYLQNNSTVLSNGVFKTKYGLALHHSANHISSPLSPNLFKCNFCRFWHFPIK